MFPKKIKAITDRGGTDIAGGMNEALTLIKGRKFKNPVTSVFLLSDGLNGGA